jgi:hypothetical protein
MNESNNPKVKLCHLAIGVDFLGSKTSFDAGRNYDLEATSIGVRIKSLSSGRDVVIPYSNVKGFEMLQEGSTSHDARLGSAARASQALKEARDEIEKRGQKIEPQFIAPQISEEEQLAQAQASRKAARAAAKEAALKAMEEQRNK